MKDPPASPDARVPQVVRRRFLINASAFAGVSLLSRLVACGGGGGSPAAPVTASPAPATPTSPPETADVRAKVSFRQLDTSARVESRYLGLSYEKDELVTSMFSGTNTALIQLFRLLGPAVLRIGANAVDRSSWEGRVSGLTPISPSQIDALAEFVQATQWQVIYGVNLAHNTPLQAASEAAYVAARLGPSLLAWEIGNEPDLYPRHHYRPSTWGYRDYLKEWRTFRDRMSQASPGVSFSGPATAFDVADYTLPFAKDEGARLGMLTHHYYRADGHDPHSTLALLLQPDLSLVTDLSRLVPAAAAEAIAQGVRLAEANSFYNGGAPNVSNTFGAALWVLDFMFISALAGCTGVNMHGGGSGPGYTPIADHDGVVIEARPEFYGMLMFAHAVSGLTLQGTIDADATINVSAWGVKRNDGGLNALLINKDDSRRVSMDLDIGTLNSFDPLWLMGTGLSASTGQTLGGVPVGSDGSWIAQPQEPLRASDGRLQALLPSASAVLLRSV